MVYAHILWMCWRPTMGGEVHASTERAARSELGQRREAIVCICAECKKVIKIVGEVTSDSNPVISHGICPECAHILYGHLFRRPPDR